MRIPRGPAFPVGAAPGIKSIRRHREVRRIRRARYIGLTQGIHGNTVGNVRKLAPQIRRVKKRGTVGADLRYERILWKVLRSPCIGLKRMRGGKVTGESPAGDERAAIRRYRDAVGNINVASPEVRRIRQDGVDEQRLALVIPSQTKRDLVLAFQNVANRNGALGAAFFLIGHWLAEAQFSACDLHQQVTPRISTQALDALEYESDLVRIGMGCNLKVILKLALVPVVNEVNAGIDFCRHYPTVIRNAGVPLGGVISQEVIALAQQFIASRQVRCWVSARKAHPGHHRRGLPGALSMAGAMPQHQNRFRRGQEKGIGVAPRHEPHLAGIRTMNLPNVLFEPERPTGRGCRDLGLGRCTGAKNTRTGCILRLTRGVSGHHQKESNTHKKRKNS